MEIGEHNFDAQSHRQLYDKIHGGPGHAAARTVDDAWNDFRAVMGNAKAELESAIRDANAVWVGAAGERFSGSAAPLVQWAEDARTAGVETHNAFSAQTSYYGSAKTTMPEPVQVSSTANDDYWGIPAGFTHLVGGQTDQDIEEQRANEAKREAVRVMNGYRDGASSATLGTFEPPPQVVTQVAEPDFEQPAAHQQYTPQLSDRQTVGTTSAHQHQTSQPVGTPPPVTRGGDDTHLSDARPPVDIAPRPTPTPVPSPSPTPPPITGPYPSPVVKPNPPNHRERIAHRPGPPVDGSRHTRRGPGGLPIGGGSSAGGTPRFGGGLPGTPGQPGAGQPFGPGGSSGVAPDTAANRTGTAANPVRGTASATPLGGGVMGAPQRGQGEDDVEHKAAPYLEELADVWGEEDVQRVAPPVIGDDDR
ncbi:PPE family protein [Actinosynnema sp. CS-041913]|uniref:PPE family protein n=1 Tax=Actinosynnema sp. CS-041913 TaxID=3239917 RepID=UPI003D8E7A7D